MHTQQHTRLNLYVETHSSGHLDSRLLNCHNTTEWSSRVSALDGANVDGGTDSADASDSRGHVIFAPGGKSLVDRCGASAICTWNLSHDCHCGKSVSRTVSTNAAGHRSGAVSINLV
jgi:hypothetical protein